MPPPERACSVSAVAKNWYSVIFIRTASSRRAASNGMPIETLSARMTNSDLVGSSESADTVRKASAIGMPTRTERTMVLSASGNCASSLALRRLLNQLKMNFVSASHTAGQPKM